MSDDKDAFFGLDRSATPARLDPARPLPPSSEPSWRKRLRAEGAAAERALIIAWLGHLADVACGDNPRAPLDPFLMRAFDAAANAIALGRLGPPPGATVEYATAKATKPARVWKTLEEFRKENKS